MKISYLKIANFRGLRDIKMEIDSKHAIVVGPNAIGKTTILEAIRFAKAALMPRYSQETQHVLASSGAVAPHPLLGQYFEYSAIARDSLAKLEISMKIILSQAELAKAIAGIKQISLNLLRARIAQPDEQGNQILAQYLSTDEGQAHLSKSEEELEKRLRDMSAGKPISICMEMTPDQPVLKGNDIYAQTIISYLERALSPSRCLFSYFPADRALPAGETNVQINAGEAAAQMQSHLGQPHTKYQRMKQVIVNAIMLGGFNDQNLKDEFQDIFNHLIPGKALEGLSLTPLGNLRVAIKDKQSDKIFDIDGMSSGEKGLTLTFLMIKYSLEFGGIVLFDEPELHLNPAVCRAILPYLLERVGRDLDLQFIMCTHSADIVNEALDREDCCVFHLRNHDNATKIYQGDRKEMFEALRRLGTSPAESLFQKGFIFFEGEHDVALVEHGFFDLVSGYRLSSLGGRSEVEKDIEAFKEAEKKGDLEKIHCFIFDLDRNAAKRERTRYIRSTQWDRYCIENYLINRKALFDVISRVSTSGPDNRGDFERMLDGFIGYQRMELVAKKVYEKYGYDNPGFRAKEIHGKNFSEMANVLVARLMNISTQISAIESEHWKTDFIEKCNLEDENVRSSWSENYLKEISGKTIVDDIYRRFSMRIPKIEFKKQVLDAMIREGAEEIRLMKSIITDALSDSIQ